MLTVDYVELPVSIRTKLRERASFSETFATFNREHLAGFRQPVAAVAATILPVLVAFVYLVSDFFTMLEVALTFLTTTAVFLAGAWFVNRGQIREAYQQTNLARRRAREDLKAGKGTKHSLQLPQAAVFYEHEHGVIVLAEADNGQTVYFDVSSDNGDPRWFLYLNGDMHRADWTWLRLAGSGDIVEFKPVGRRLMSFGETPFVEAPDAWEAISLALGEPLDGDIINLSFEEARQTISRLL